MIVKTISIDDETQRRFKLVKNSGVGISYTIRELFKKHEENGYSFEAKENYGKVMDNGDHMSITIELDSDTIEVIEHAQETHSQSIQHVIRRILKQYRDDGYKFKGDRPVI